MNLSQLDGHIQNKETDRILRSEDLLKDKREVVILHGRENYRLKLTKAGKLILNK